MPPPPPHRNKKSRTSQIRIEMLHTEFIKTICPENSKNKQKYNIHINVQKNKKIVSKRILEACIKITHICGI